MRWISLVVISLTATGCASFGKSSSSALPKTVSLEFKGRSGETTDTRYYSNARILTYENEQLVRDRFEGVDFTVASHVTDYDSKEKLLKFDVNTTRKDGTVELHDLAFPELNEQIDYVIRTNGEVLQAGRYPPQSLFYVPSLPIPERAVEVGDTWTMDHTWFSSRDAIPLKLEVVGILKAIVPCEKNQVCADVEISGSVNLVARPTTAGSRFESRMWGRLLFSMARGDVIWSEMRSREEMGVQSDRMIVRSCMVSEMKINELYKTKFACDPNQEPVGATPVF